MNNDKTYKEMLRDLDIYTEEQLASWTENECKGEYQELSLGGET